MLLRPGNRKAENPKKLEKNGTGLGIFGKIDP
jgi:hypothetical protein